MSLRFLLGLLLTTIFAIVCAAFIATNSIAATLRSDVTVSGDLVTLGDLFEGAGDLAARPVFQAPDAGIEGALPADAAHAAAERAGLRVQTSPLKTVRVIRASSLVSAETFSALLRKAIADKTGKAENDLALAFDGTVTDVPVDAKTDRPVSLTSFAFAPSSGRFQASFSVDKGAAHQTLTLTGLATATVEAVMLNRSLARRDVFAAEDVALRRIDSRRLPPGSARSLDEVIGKAARRQLRPGEFVLQADLEEPLVVERGTIVTLVYEEGALLLTARGRALASAGIGGTVSVLNEQSRRTVEGTAIASGKVRVKAGPSGLTR